MAKPEKTKIMTVKVSESLHRALRIRAARDGRKINEAMRDALTVYLHPAHNVLGGK